MYLLYHNTSKCLVKLIVTAVPLLYIEELEDPILKFGNVSPFEILEQKILIKYRVHGPEMDTTYVH